MKTGPGRNSNSRVALVVDERPGEVGGQQVGGELGAGEVQAERLREGARGEGLAEAREVLEQHVAVGEEPGQHELERLALADDGGLDLVEDSLRELSTCVSSSSTSDALQRVDEVRELSRRDASADSVAWRGPRGAHESHASSPTMLRAAYLVGIEHDPAP